MFERYVESALRTLFFARREFPTRAASRHDADAYQERRARVTRGLSPVQVAEHAGAIQEFAAACPTR